MDGFTHTIRLSDIINVQKKISVFLHLTII